MDMHLRPGKGTSSSKSEKLEEYEDRYYKELKTGSVKIRLSNSFFRCPYCDRETRRDYSFGELLRHASYKSRESKSADTKEKGKHLALERYLEKHFSGTDRSEGSLDDNRGKEAQKADHGEQPLVRTHNDNRLFVWPPMAIVANIKRNVADARTIGESGSKLRDELLGKGLKPVKVEPLWSRQGHSGFAVVKFKSDWVGFCDSLSFENSFESQKCGKKDYYESRDRGDRLYGWVARDADYHSGNLIGWHLQKKGDLKSVTEKQEEEMRNQSRLEASLKDAIEIKSSHIEKMTIAYEHTNRALDHVMSQKDAMEKAHNEQTREMQLIAQKHFEKLFLEHEKAKMKVEAQKEKLRQQEKELEKREFSSESKRRELRDMIERASLEQKKHEENIQKLAKEQEREKEDLRRRIINLQKELDDRQALELEIQRMKGALKVKEHMKDDKDPDAKEKMNEMEEELKEKEEELESMDAATQALIVKHRSDTDELFGARKELISFFGEMNLGRAAVGVKRMGELDIKPFQAAAKRKYGKAEAGLEGSKLCSLWQDHIRDGNWHPFKIIYHDGEPKEIIDEDDEKLKPLREEFGNEVYEAVVTALTELNEHNPSGRYPVPELWNFKEKRRARLAEGVERLLGQWKTCKKRRT